MKKLADDLKSVNKEIQSLSKKLEQVSKKAEKLMKAVADQKAKAKTAPKKKVAKKAKTTTPKKATGKKETVPAEAVAGKEVKKKVKKNVKKAVAPDTPTSNVLILMKRYKKGVTIAKLKERSGLNDKQISNILHRAGKDGKIKRIARGVYQLA